jgi:hypothetical protein
MRHFARVATAIASLVLLCCPSALATRWSAPVTLSPADQQAVAPRVAVNARGDEAVVWRNRLDDFNATVQLSVRPAGGAFSAPIAITEAPGQNETPSVAVGPEGRVLVLWAVEADTEYLARELVVASWGSVDGGAFTAPKAISGYEGGNGFMYPQAAIAGDGEGLAIWRGLDEQVHWATSAPGSESFSAPRAIANPSEDLFNQTVAVSSNGAAVVAWTDYSAVYSAVREPGGSFGATQTVESKSCAGDDLHAAIDDAGAAVLDWSVDWRELSEKECEVGGTPTWLRAAYRSPGKPFDVPVNAAEMEGWSRAGGVAVSPAGRVSISAKGKLLSPTATSYDTALTRLSNGAYGDPEAIVQKAPVEEPAVLAYDAAGNLYAAADTRTYEEGPEEGVAIPVSGVLANIAPAGGRFATESIWLQSGLHGFDSLPVVAAAGEGHALAAWEADGRLSRIELSEAQPGEQSSGEASPSGSEETVPGTGEQNVPAGQSATSAGAARGVAGTIASRSAVVHAAPRRRLTVTGRSERAGEVVVRLVRSGRVVRSVRARLRQGRFEAVLSIAGVPPGHYRLQILRRRGSSQRTEVRAANLR